MTNHQKNVFKVAQDLIDNGAIEVEILAHVFGCSIKIYLGNKCTVGIYRPGIMIPATGGHDGS